MAEGVEGLPGKAKAVAQVTERANDRAGVDPGGSPTRPKRTGRAGLWVARRWAAWQGMRLALPQKCPETLALGKPGYDQIEGSGPNPNCPGFCPGKRGLASWTLRAAGPHQPGCRGPMGDEAGEVKPSRRESPELPAWRGARRRLGTPAPISIPWRLPALTGHHAPVALALPRPAESEGRRDVEPKRREKVFCSEELTKEGLKEREMAKSRASGTPPSGAEAATPVRGPGPQAAGYRAERPPRPVAQGAADPASTASPHHPGVRGGFAPATRWSRPGQGLGPECASLGLRPRVQAPACLRATSARTDQSPRGESCSRGRGGARGARGGNRKGACGLQGAAGRAGPEGLGTRVALLELADAGSAAWWRVRKAG